MNACLASSRKYTTLFSVNWPLTKLTKRLFWTLYCFLTQRKSWHFVDPKDLTRFSRFNRTGTTVRSKPIILELRRNGFRPIGLSYYVYDKRKTNKYIIFWLENTQTCSRSCAWLVMNAQPWYFIVCSRNSQISFLHATVLLRSTFRRQNCRIRKLATSFVPRIYCEFLEDFTTMRTYKYSCLCFFSFSWQTSAHTYSTRCF